MTPKLETAHIKAKELVDRFRLNVLDYEDSGINTHKAKQCALIALDEILNVIDGFEMIYWEAVKKEIEKL